MQHKGHTGITRVIKATGYSWAGLRAAFIYESAFRQEIALTVVLAPLGLWLGHDGVERALLLGSLLLVLIVELLNSAVEAVVDRGGTDHNELAKRAKDIGSAAVFIALANVVIVWALVLVR
jgi:diacylglycerol kinase (ATP)